MNALEDGIRAAAAIAGDLDGDSDSRTRYAQYLDARYTDYVANRNYLYGLERRWPNLPFWRQRHARSGAVQSAGERAAQQQILVAS
jgi:hypothetical protein